ncbi:predicted protein [Histoplasma capsulatum var. duboisii H88]|uniref:Predicted protein n=1 Tax=Ajellomyces capsulatus (strain H88) TaxID=544711 RepID=F0UF21_AJEC8|nr:predicted protein [Histoplasma capsulatum var. duboisii H88]
MGLPNVKPYLLMPLLFNRCVSDAIQPLLAALPYEPNGRDIKFLRMLARNCCFYSAGQEVVDPLSKASACTAGDKTAFGFEFQGVARVLPRTIAMLSGEDAWLGIRIFQDHELP